MWIEVCNLDAFPERTVRTIELEGLSIAVFRLADGRLLQSRIAVRIAVRGSRADWCTAMTRSRASITGGACV